MTLRSELIEAIAEVLQAEFNARGLARLEAVFFAEPALDALVTYLTEHADEWADHKAAECGPGDCDCPSDAQVLGLLEVLSAPINPEAVN